MQPVNNQQSPSVKFRFTDIGPVKQAELELGDLTIIAGRNNTGKTYLVYTLYGFLKMWYSWPNARHFLIGNDEIAQNDDTNEADSDDEYPEQEHYASEDEYLEDMESAKEGKPLHDKWPNLPQRIGMLARRAIKEGQATWTIDREHLDQERKKVIKSLAQSFSKTALYSVFSSSPDDFKRASLNVELISEFPQNHSLEEKFPSGDVFFIRYNGEKIVLTRDRTKKQRRTSFDEEELFFIPRLYLRFLFPELFWTPFVLSAERFGISLFYKELDFTKNQLVDLLQKVGAEKNRARFSPFFLIDKTTSRYALPIKDNIDYTRNLSDFQKQISELHEHKLFDEIKDMIRGYYKSSGDDIKFKSTTRNKEHSFSIPLHLASSSARGLSDLYFFLRHVAEKNHLLIIDEPESHLDTTNQILLARLLARLVRTGLKVLITTHSDYLVKEINNLIMLSNSFEDKDRVMRKLGYKEDDFLEPDSIRAYVAEENRLTKCAVDKFGVEMPIFDATIDAINRASNELASRLRDTES